MRQWKLIVALAMCLAFIAGTLIGWGRSRMQRPGDWGGRHGGPPELRFKEELGLSSSQTDQMRQIWEGLMEQGPKDFERRREIERDCRARAEALLTPEQRKQYDAMVADAEKKLAALDEEREARFAGAIARTQALLTPAQREEFEKIMSQHRGGPGGHHGPGRPHGGDGMGPGFGLESHFGPPLPPPDDEGHRPSAPSTSRP